MTEIAVSIICTNYNKGSWIADAIESFLQQQLHEPFEIIIVDDASNDQSPNVIAQYAAAYPEKIRAFYHQTNLGITKTWIDICQQARGEYIARCDGDDYWIDPFKLQKQLTLLRQSPDAKWCNTDFHLIDHTGKLVQENVFQSGLIKNANTFERLIASKGFTFPSSWLIDAELTKEVNANIDPNAVDDTFNIQLELFMKTSLVTLLEATVVYRIHSGSDSRPLTPTLAKQRFDGLLKAQLHYLFANPAANRLEIAQRLMEKDAEMDMKIFEKDGMIAHLENQLNELRQQVVALEEKVESLSETATIAKKIDQDG